MTMNKKTKLNRRKFLQTSSAAATFTILHAGSARTYAANEKVNVAIVGTGGIGSADTKGCAKAGANIAALCDVDRRRIRGAREHPKARLYADFREMLDKEHKHLDGVVVATPDHTHASISIAAMRRGLHCYCQKPLSHDAWEAKRMAEVAAEEKVITMIGSPMICDSRAEGYRAQREAVLAEAAGGVVESHVGVDHTPCVLGASRPAGSDPVPERLNWDLWLGPAPQRPFVAHWPEDHSVRQQKSWAARIYHKKDDVYHPFVWRGWWDFGTGLVGDLGAHSFNQTFYTLELDQPIAVECLDAGPFTEDMYPEWCVLRWDYPARGKHPPLSLFWYLGKWHDGDWGKAQGGRRKAGWVYSKEKPGKLPDATGGALEATTGDWLDGIRTSRNPAGDFAFSAKVAIGIALGNIALRTRSRIKWDAATFDIPNDEVANQHVRPARRKGWEI